MSRAQPVSGPTISLFPFLAVLLCTMGALLVVLVLFSRAVREGVVADAADERTQVEQDLELARDGLAWRLRQLDGVRERTGEELATARVQLAGVEENIRALEDELKKLEQVAMALESGSKAHHADAAAIKELEERLASARESLDKARAEQRTKPPAYAVVPYVGRQGTHRRPLYIECAGDGVFLQPENIRLGPADFQGPPGPGNPLASALRAAREQILTAHGGANDPGMQPYPLLIVRPSGVMAYYAAREAIQSWGSDFGYQLVDEDWTLAFPPADPTLAEVERRAIDESRQRLAWLAEVRPSRPARQPRQYRAAPTRGGVVSDEGPSVLGDQSRWDWAAGGADAAGPGRSGDGSVFGNGRGTGSGGMAGGGRNGEAGGSFRQSVFTAGTGQGSPGGGQPSGGMPSGHGTATAGGPATTGPAGPARGNAGAITSDASASGGPGGGPGGGPSAGRGGADGSGGSGPTGAIAASGPSAAGGAAGGLTGGAAGGDGAAGNAGSSAAGGASSRAAGGAGGPAMPGLAKRVGGQSDSPSSASASVSMAQSRGKNWASLATQDRPIPLTRPIRLECSLNEFRIMDDSGRRVQTRIPIDGATDMAIDPLVKAIHARVETWGIAGDRMYWKPELVLSETVDGRSRREDLERLLADSGLDVRPGENRDQIRPLPPVARTAAVLPGR